jgi:hypothetical protein
MIAARLAALLVALGACGSSSGGECPAPTADCNDDAADGCESDLTSPVTCGDCDTRCQAPPGASARCVESICAFECEPGLVQCVNDCLTSCPHTFDTPGEEDPFAIPLGCFRISVRAWGGGGGDGENNTSGGAGGFATAELDVEPGDPMVVAVGGAGGDGANNAGGAGGALGGGVGGDGGSQPGGGGGGLSGLFAGALAVDGALVIAGGGGGSGGDSGGQVVGGAGGGVTGESTATAQAGTTDTGFGPLTGGPGSSRANGDGGGGGGAGWFGGEGGASAGSDAGGGAGGSGFAIATADNAVLEAGVGTIPGNPGDGDRGTAGDPGEAGLVIVTCIPR